MPLLSVCIPTRNRPDALLKTVGTITEQIRSCGAQDEVEVVVCDNTDHDDLRVDPAQWGRGQVRYFVNQGNIGYARNINRVILEARGTYSWLLADDDVVKEDAVESILQALRRQDGEEICYLTFFSGSDRPGAEVENIYFRDCQQEYFRQGTEFLRQYWQSVIFVSTNIFHREKLLAHARREGLLDNWNDVFQNSLLCLSFIDRAGCVRVIPKTLLSDSFRDKLYSPENAVRTSVVNYAKLLAQFRALGCNPAWLRRLQGVVEDSVVFNGLRFAVVRQVTPDGYDYAAAFREVAGSTQLPARTRFKAGVMAAVLGSHRRFAGECVRLLFVLRGRKTLYEDIRRVSRQWFEQVQQSKLTISY